MILMPFLSWTAHVSDQMHTVMSRGYDAMCWICCLPYLYHVLIKIWDWCLLSGLRK